jgi:hypothetical protein
MPVDPATADPSTSHHAQYGVGENLGAAGLLEDGADDGARGDDDADVADRAPEAVRDHFNRA